MLSSNIEPHTHACYNARGINCHLSIFMIHIYTHLCLYLTLFIYNMASKIQSYSRNVCKLCNCGDRHVHLITIISYFRWTTISHSTTVVLSHFSRSCHFFVKLRFTNVLFLFWSCLHTCRVQKKKKKIELRYIKKIIKGKNMYKFRRGLDWSLVEPEQSSEG